MVRTGALFGFHDASPVIIALNQMFTLPITPFSSNNCAFSTIHGLCIHLTHFGLITLLH